MYISTSLIIIFCLQEFVLIPLKGNTGMVPPKNAHPIDLGNSDEALQDELSVIDIQLGYCAQISQNQDEAQKLYNEVLKAKYAKN